MKNQRCLWLCLVLTCLSISAYGQSGGSGSISGQVADQTKAVVPEATVVATNVNTGVKTQTVTTGAGYYSLLNLVPGSYAITVEAKNFKRMERKGITVQVSDKLTLDFALEIGEITQIVDISAEAPLLRTQDAQTGEVVTNSMIQNLPQLNRDPLQLLTFSGGVQGSGGRADSMDQDTRINGGRNQSIDYLVDGISAVTGRGHTVGTLAPSMDGVGEFKVITNPVSAEYGRVSGGLVELSTKSGSNQFHGQVFDYVQNTILNANSWNQNRLGGERTPFNQNVFGAAVGGPVIIPRVMNGRNKTFFFFNYDGLRFVQKGVLNTASVATDAMRNGDFTDVKVGDNTPLIYDPAPGLPQSWDDNRKQWERLVIMGGDGKHIPASRIHPVSAALNKYYPMSNRNADPGCSYCNNYMAPQNTTNTSNDWAIRIDHMFNERHNLYARFNRSVVSGGSTNWMGEASTAPGHQVDGGFGITLNYAWTISPTMIFTARLGAHYSPYLSGNTLSSSFDNSSIPFDSITKSMLGGTNTLPAINIENMSTIGGDNTSVSASTTGEFAVGLTKLTARHALKFGYEGRRWYDNYWASGSSNSSFWFLGLPTFQYVHSADWTNEDYAQSYAAYLLGYSDYSNMSGATTRALNMNYHAGYVQDDFKISPKLTLNLGFRWEMETPTTDRYDNLFVWDQKLPSPFGILPDWNFANIVNQNVPAELDPAQVISRAPAWAQPNGSYPKGAIAMVNTPEHPSRKSTNYNPWQFSPRIGMAYSLDQKTVLRASFAKVYLPTTGNPNAFGVTSDGWTTAQAAIGPWAQDDGSGIWRYFISTWDHPWPVEGQVSNFQRTSQYANYMSTRQDSLGVVDVNMHQAYELVWNVGLQREFPGNWLLEANYSANRGVGLLGKELINQIPKDLISGGPGGRNEQIYNTVVPTPFPAGQTQYSPTGDSKMTLGRLMQGYPYYGATGQQGLNVGTSMYHSLNLRAEHRFQKGMSLLFNYTLSNLKDDVGGPGSMAQNGKSVYGGGKWSQSVDSARSVYGTSIWDERHRISATYQLELPFGRNRFWLKNLYNQGIGGKLMDAVVGGWVMAGNGIWRSGRPIQWPADTRNAGFGAEVIGPAVADAGDQNFRNRAITDWNQIFRSPSDPIPTFNTGILDVTKFIYNSTDKVYGYQVFTVGNIPTMYEGVRNPGITQFDLSFMKRVPLFSRDESRYLQLRMEAQNLFNMHGYGDINVDPRNTQTFGFISGIRNTERRIQMSLKFVF